MEECKVLSASRIKTLESCSWSYWCNYHLKIPQKSNDGALRGTICHLVFELLLNPKHRNHYDMIMKKSDVEDSKGVIRLVKKHLKKNNILTKENFEMCKEMIIVGFNHSFFGTGEEVEQPSSELEFILESKKPKYKIKGFIDKVFKYKDKVKIVDYKTSKYKFKGDELSANVQAMTYTLASKKKIFPDIKNVEIEFQFLRFPKQPLQQVNVTEDQLKGFEHYLAHVYELINNFDQRSARTNFAADSQKTTWLCKAGATWKCPYYDPVEYYAIKNEFDEIVSTAFSKEGLKKVKSGEKIVKLRYEGCPAHHYSATSSENLNGSEVDNGDPFDLG